jgi:hypothetical protein
VQKSRIGVPDDLKYRGFIPVKKRLISIKGADQTIAQVFHAGIQRKQFGIAGRNKIFGVIIMKPIPVGGGLKNTDTQVAGAYGAVIQQRFKSLMINFF